MLRLVLLVIWLLLSAWILVWTGEGLFGMDQRRSILPFTGGDPLAAPILIGVAWGLLLTVGGVMLGPRRPRKRAGRDQIGIGRIVETVRTGASVNDVPQYDIFLRVAPKDGDDFIAQARMLVEPTDVPALRIGHPVAVHYRPGDEDAVELADPRDPAVADALIEWRVERGLIDPRQVRARTSGTAVPASVLTVRPTGRRLEGQSELALRVLMAPEDAASWEADTTLFVHPEAIPLLQVGAPVWGFYRREDPSTVGITIEKEAGR